MKGFNFRHRPRQGVNDNQKIRVSFSVKRWLPLVCLLPLPALAGGLLVDLLAEDAQTRLEAYAEQQAWPEYRVTARSWLPAASARLPVCQRNLIYQPADPERLPYGRIPYQISCSEPNWQIEAAVEIHVRLPIWMLTEAKNRNDIIDGDDLVSRHQDIRRQYTGFVPANKDVVGLRVMRSLREGRPLEPGHLAAAE